MLGKRVVYDANTRENWLSGCVLMLGGAILAYTPSAISFRVISILSREPAPSLRETQKL
jgi:hypothetical protein